MRAKINKHLDQEHIKHAAGGLLDLEFLVQYLVLAHPQQQVAGRTNTLAQLQLLFNNNVLNHRQLSKLKRAYKTYHQVSHQLILQPGKVITDIQQADVLAISQQFLLDGK